MKKIRWATAVEIVFLPVCVVAWIIGVVWSSMKLAFDDGKRA